MTAAVPGYAVGCRSRCRSTPPTSTGTSPPPRCPVWRSGGEGLPGGPCGCRTAPGVVASDCPSDGAVPVELRARRSARRGGGGPPGPAHVRPRPRPPRDAARCSLRTPRSPPLVIGAPGRRVPGTLDPEAMVLRAVLGQQVSTAAARTHAARLVAAFGHRLAVPVGGLTHLFPRAAALAADPGGVAEVARLPRSRIRTLLAVATALAEGTVRPAGRAGRGAGGAARGAGDRAVDRGHRADAGAGGPRRVPADRPRRSCSRLVGWGCPSAARQLEAHSRRWSPVPGLGGAVPLDDRCPRRQHPARGREAASSRSAAISAPAQRAPRQRAAASRQVLIGLLVPGSRPSSSSTSSPVRNARKASSEVVPRDASSAATAGSRWAGPARPRAPPRS